MSDPRFDGARAKGQKDREGWDLLEKIERAGVYEVSIRTLILEKDGVGIDDRSVDRLVESASRRGGWIHYPVVQKGSNKVIVGKRRVLADKKAGKQKVWVRIVDLTDQEASLWRLEENAVRFNPDKKELYVTFKALRDPPINMTQEEMATASGFSHGYISKILAWGDAGFSGSPSRQLFPGNNSIPQGQGESAGPESGSPPLSLRVAPTLEPPEPTGAASGESLAPAPPDSLPSQGGKGGGGQPIPEVATGSETSRPPAAAPAIPPTVPPEAQEGPTHAHLIPETGERLTDEEIGYHPVEFVTADKIPASLPQPQPGVAVAAPSFSVPVSQADLGTYRSFVNAYLQTAIKAAKKGDLDARTHLHAIHATISEALG